VTLRTFVINGDKHTVWLEAPDGSTAAGEVVMNRGREYNFQFTADLAGYYTLHCDEHDPTMSATILVLPGG
jgi:plastocyanin